MHEATCLFFLGKNSLSYFYSSIDYLWFHLDFQLTTKLKDFILYKLINYLRIKYITYYQNTIYRQSLVNTSTFHFEIKVKNVLLNVTIIKFNKTFK